MLEGFVGGNPFGRVHRQHLIDEVFCFRRDGIPFRSWILEKDRGPNVTKEDRGARTTKGQVVHDLRRRSRTLSVHTTVVDPRPRRGGNRPVRYKG
jgi:hypothetical protein